MFDTPVKADPAGGAVVSDTAPVAVDLRDADAGVARDLADDGSGIVRRCTDVQVRRTGIDDIGARGVRSSAGSRCRGDGTAGRAAVRKRLVGRGAVPGRGTGGRRGGRTEAIPPVGSRGRQAVRIALVADIEVDVADEVSAVVPLEFFAGGRIDDAVTVVGIGLRCGTLTDGDDTAVDAFHDQHMVRVDGEALGSRGVALREAVVRVIGVPPVCGTVDRNVLARQFSGTGRGEPGAAAAAVCIAGGFRQSGVGGTVDVDIDTIEAVVHDAGRSKGSRVRCAEHGACCNADDHQERRQNGQDFFLHSDNSSQ